MKKLALIAVMLFAAISLAGCSSHSSSSSKSTKPKSSETLAQKDEKNYAAFIKYEEDSITRINNYTETYDTRTEEENDKVSDKIHDMVENVVKKEEKLFKHSQSTDIQQQQMSQKQQALLDAENSFFKKNLNLAQ